jgi:hypothetical protein
MNKLTVPFCPLQFTRFFVITTAEKEHFTDIVLEDYHENQSSVSG